MIVTLISRFFLFVGGMLFSNFGILYCLYEVQTNEMTFPNKVYFIVSILHSWVETPEVLGRVYGGGHTRVWRLSPLYHGEECIDEARPGSVGMRTRPDDDGVYHGDTLKFFYTEQTHQFNLFPWSRPVKRKGV